MEGLSGKIAVITGGGGVLPSAIAEGLAREGGRFLRASVVYRALLESILARAQTRYYHHGVRYLKKLHMLSAAIEDWRGIPPCQVQRGYPSRA